MEPCGNSFIMKKILLLVAAYLVCAGAQAQDLVEFKLQPDGSFLAPNGENYVVLEYDGKTASELYSLVKSNVMTLYNSPKDVMSENENVSISIRAFSDMVGTKTILLPRIFSGYYNLVFRFKDGKIRVDAPIFDDKIKDRDNLLDPMHIPTFRGLVKSFFYKDGQPKEKFVDNIKFTESPINYTINCLVGNVTTKTNNDNW